MSLLNKLFSSYSGLSRGIYILFFARIINCLGNFVTPFLAMYLTKNLGMDEQRTGLFIMVSLSAAVPGMLVGGTLADRFGRKNIIAMSLFLSACCYIACAFLGSSPAVPWLLILWSFLASAMHPAMNAMIADLTAPSERTSAYSLQYLGINIGMAVGPIVAGFLFNNYIKLLFLGDAVTSIISAVLITIFIKESIPSDKKAEHTGCGESADDGAAIRENTLALLLKRPFLLVFSLISIVVTFVYSQHVFSIPIYVNKIFNENGPKIFGTVMTVNCLIVVFTTTFIVSVTKKFKPVLNASFAAVFYAIGFGMLLFSNNMPLIILSTVIWTIGEILTTTNFDAYVADHSPESHRGRFSAVISFVSRSGFAAGPAVMGVFIKHNGVNMVWPVLFVLSMLSAALLYVLFISENSYNLRKKNTCINSK